MSPQATAQTIIINEKTHRVRSVQQRIVVLKQLQATVQALERQGTTIEGELETLSNALKAAGFQPEPTLP